MYVLLDIGGTNTRLAVSKDHQIISDPIIFPTDQNFEEAMKNLRGKIQEQTQGERIDALAGAVKSLDASKKTLKPHPVFPLWVNKPLHEKLSEITQAPVHLENDAALAGLGEVIFTNLRNYPIVAYITVGTGVGGVRIVNGMIDKNSKGFEPGFQIIGEEGFLENYISGTAIEKKYGKKAGDINDERIWDEIAKFLAIGLNNITVLWSPDIIILGGSVMKSIPLENLEYYFKENVAIFPKLPKIQPARLGDESGLFGALELLNSGNS